MQHRSRLLGVALAGLLTAAAIATAAPGRPRRHRRELRETFTASLPAGTCCNVAKASPDACDGNTVTVGDDGTVRAAVPAKSALALHTGARS